MGTFITLTVRSSFGFAFDTMNMAHSVPHDSLVIVQIIVITPASSIISEKQSPCSLYLRPPLEVSNAQSASSAEIYRCRIRHFTHADSSSGFLPRLHALSHCRLFSLHLNSSLRLARLHPNFMNSFLSNSSALALLLTSTHKHTLKKAFSSRLSLLGFFSLGVPLVAIRNSAFRGSSFR